jgi:hypothetical protein
MREASGLPRAEMKGAQPDFGAPFDSSLCDELYTSIVKTSVMVKIKKSLPTVPALRQFS